ncbi:MAG: diacylglycerol kinase, partial [Thiotrichaceae bacterium]|nr:diacylglycerol kinase [Thiotrichaceae bacterium]
MDFESIFGFKRFYKAIFYSFAGYKAALNSEQAFRQEVILLIFVIPLVIWMAKSPVESVLLLGSIILIMIVELLNTAIEFVVDRISSDHHELSG